MNKLVMWEPVLITLPFSLAYRYVAMKFFGRSWSWGSLIAMNAFAVIPHRADL